MNVLGIASIMTSETDVVLASGAALGPATLCISGGLGMSLVFQNG